MAEEKTEKASPKRKKDEREKGNVFKSQEVTVAVSLIATFYGIKLLLPMTLSQIQMGLEDYIGRSATITQLSYPTLRELFLSSFLYYAIAALPILLITGFVAFLVTMAQTRLLVSFKSMQPKAERISLLKGIKRMFSLKGVIELLKSLIKIVIIGYIIWNAMKDQIPLLSRLMGNDPRQAMGLTGDIILSTAQSVAIAFAFVAAADYFYQWWDYEKNLRMSKQEVKEEYKQTEGDPQIKGKIKEKQQQAARKRMMQNVPSADVVIRNPTHFAVALKYQPSKNRAPMVVAKGMDRVALKIIEVAQQNQVTVIENKPLARGLYDAVELDQEIPENYYQAVAEVLAFVYRLKKKKDLK